jgi:5-methylcytosine-specific restriction endonuclease McrA
MLSSSRWARYPSDERYRTADWSERRREQLVEHPECQIRLPGCTGKASHADHIWNLKTGGPWDGPLQSACPPCHRRKSSSEGGAARKLKYGPRPGAA